MLEKKIIQGKTKVLIYIALCCGIAGGLLLFVPFVRTLIIAFGETVIIHRPVRNVFVWHEQIVSWARSILLVIFLFWLFMLSNFPLITSFIKKKWYTAIGIALIILFALETIFLSGLNKSIWLDEAYSLALIRHSWKDLVSITAADVHPPLYYFILKAFSIISGSSIFAMKLVSIIPEILTVVFSFLFFNKKFGAKTAVLLLLSIMASKSILYYGIEIRMYSWALFFVTMAAITAWYAITSDKSKWYVLFLVCALGAAYTQYYAAVTVGIGYLFMLIYTIRSGKRRIATVFALGVFALLLYSPWIPIVIKQFTRVSGSFWIGPITLLTIGEYVLTVFSAGNALLSLVVFALFCIVFVVFLRGKDKTFNDYFFLCSLCCTIALAVFGIAVSITIRPIFVSRYLIPACGLVWLFFAYECGKIKYNRFTTLVSVLFFCFNIIAFINTVSVEYQEDKDFDNFYTYISSRIEQDDIIVLMPPDKSVHMIGIMAYLFPGHIQVITDKNKAVAENDFFERTVISYQESGEMHNHRKWLLITEGAMNAEENNFLSSLNLDEAFCGMYGWGSYKFKLYLLD
jgi:uncharacterized membrane protein